MRQRTRRQTAQRITEKVFNMSFALKMTALGAFIVLLAANIIVFAKTQQLSDEMVALETQTQELRKENARLEQMVYSQNSLTNLNALADQLGFTKQAEPLYLEAGEYALVP